ncbi:unnamed protein product [Arctia plantaginis]|uniref:Alpha-1,6-mannosyl-glycoprotein 2-beta-N-acetylglucosaminyltransferase n=1 Tax=Arctia plantaginis TaxID=874455 RepID=A0A8S0Z1S5_ARCPL|nr:unnamed protein product [Arctia plantaginis]
MTVNPNTLVRIFIAIFLVTISVLAFQVYQHAVFLQDQRKQLIHDYYDANVDDNVSYDLMIEEDLHKRKIRRSKISKMKSNIRRINLKQRVYNAEFLYGITNVTYIIVIQVHNDVYLFKQLLDSLRTAHSIASALLIFSHDVFETKMNQAVHTVNFARYMQIFYPYSIQLHPFVYPGVAYASDDKENTEKSKERDPVAAQKKLHWWWQVNQVFDNLSVTKNYTKTILFLQENDYVTEDFLIVLKLLEHVRGAHCPVCEIISLGAHSPEPGNYLNRTAVVALEIWAKNLPNIGIAFNRDIWHIIKGWSRDFCDFNDYTWENSLKYIGSQHMDINFYFTDIIASRVFRIECGKENPRCDLKRKLDDVKSFTQVIRHSLYPAILMLRIVKGKDYSVDALGSFQDERDRELCMYFTKNCVWY